MGLMSQLMPALVCLLACTSSFTQGHRHSLTLRETIKMLNSLTAKKVSELSGTISPDVWRCRAYFLDYEEHVTASREVSQWLVEGMGDLSLALFGGGTVGSFLSLREWELRGKDHSA